MVLKIFFAVRNEKQTVLIDKSVYLGLSTLGFSKAAIYKFFTV